MRKRHLRNRSESLPSGATKEQQQTRLNRAKSFESPRGSSEDLPSATYSGSEESLETQEQLHWSGMLINYLLSIDLSLAYFISAWKQNRFVVTLIVIMLAGLIISILRSTAFHALLIGLAGLLIGYTAATQDILYIWKSRTKLMQQLIKPIEIPEPQQLKQLPFAEKLRKTWDELLALFIRDFILYWWAPLNVSAVKEFETKLRASLYAILINARAYFRNFGSQEDEQRQLDRSTLLAYGFANVVILHLREYRAFEASELSLDEYLDKNKDKSSLFTRQALCDEQMILRVREISSILMRRLLARIDESSSTLVALVKEIVATSALFPLVKKLSQPDMINSWLLLLFASLLPGLDADEFEDAQEEKLDQKHLILELSADEMVKRNDTFALFMEYLEHRKAPAYLRFWNNTDMFRQFAEMALADSISVARMGSRSNSHGSLNLQPQSQESGTLSASEIAQENMKHDAMSLFQMHFGDEANELRIPLVTRSTYPLQKDNITDEELQQENKRRISNLLQEIEQHPNPDCFRYAQFLVLEILDKDYLDKFKHSKLFCEHFDLPYDAEKDTSDPVQISSTVNYSTPRLSFDSPALGMTESESDILSSDYESHSNSNTSVPAHLGQHNGKKEDALRHLAEAITQLREQHMLVNANIEQLKRRQTQSFPLHLPAKLPPIPSLKQLEISRQLKHLNGQKRQIERQIESYMKMAEQMEIDEESGLDDESDIRTEMLDLAEFDIQIVDLVLHFTNERGGVGTVSLLTAGNSALSKQLSASSVVFIIHMKRTKDPMAKKSILERTLTQFMDLDTRLKAKFEKCKKIPFPQLKQEQKGFMNSGILTSAVNQLTRDNVPHLPNDETKLKKLLVDLNSYLQILLVDQLLCESHEIQQFFSSLDEQPLINKQEKKKSSSIFNIINSTRSILSPSTGPPSLSIPTLKRPSSITSKRTPVSQAPSSSSFLTSFGEYGLRKVLGDAKEISFDLDLYIDTFFALMTEMFDLHLRNQWLRRKALSVLRQILLQQSRGKSKLYSVLAGGVKELMSIYRNLIEDQDTIVGWLRIVIDTYWPLPSRTFFIPPVMPVNSKQLQAEAKEKLRKLFASEDTPLINIPILSRPETPLDVALSDMKNTKVDWESIRGYLYAMVGRYNSISGCQRIFDMLQHEQLNRALLISLAEVAFKLLLENDERVY